MKWWLISDESAAIIRADLVTAIDRAHDCTDWCGEGILRNTLHELDSGMHVTDAIPSDYVNNKPTRPTVVCLCGSTRFTKQMLIKQWELTKHGFIVLSWCALPGDYYGGREKAHIGDQEGVKEIVDELHRRKIDLCDEVLVIDVGGYVGDSTRSEINYALAHGKPVKYLSELEPIVAAAPPSARIDAEMEAK